jgi:hypothetical protein
MKIRTPYKHGLVVTPADDSKIDCLCVQEGQELVHDLHCFDGRVMKHGLQKVKFIRMENLGRIIAF